MRALAVKTDQASTGVVLPRVQRPGGAGCPIGEKHSSKSRLERHGGGPVIASRRPGASRLEPPAEAGQLSSGRFIAECRDGSQATLVPDAWATLEREMPLPTADEESYAAAIVAAAEGEGRGELGHFRPSEAPKASPEPMTT